MDPIPQMPTIFSILFSLYRRSIKFVQFGIDGTMDVIVRVYSFCKSYDNNVVTFEIECDAEYYSVQY
jgi:hypothetical protein